MYNFIIIAGNGDDESTDKKKEGSEGQVESKVVGKSIGDTKGKVSNEIKELGDSVDIKTWTKCLGLS